MDSYYIKRSDAIAICEILILEALENYTLFHMTDGSKVISSSTLKIHEEKLRKRTFLRVNRSTMINVHHVKNVLQRGHIDFIRMNDGREIQVSRRRRGMLRHIAN